EGRPTCSSAATACWTASQSPSSTQHLDIFGKASTEAIRFHLEVVGGLQIQPKARRIAKEASQTQRRIGANGALAKNDLVDPSSWHMQTFCQSILRQSQRF